MKPSKFISKFKSRYLWGNLLAMVIVVIALVIGTKIGLDVYTRHGEEIEMPDLREKTVSDARHLLSSLGLNIEVGDTGYVRSLPADCILQQSIEAGSKIKAGRTIRVTINSHKTPTLAIPDIIDNCSWREARARLTGMGFRVGEPQYITGERDWVYGVTVRGHNVVAGQRVSVEDVVVVQVGDGLHADDDSLLLADPGDEYYDFDEVEADDVGADSRRAHEEATNEYGAF